MSFSSARGLFVVLLACVVALPDPAAADIPLHLRVLSIHDFHGNLTPAPYPWTEGRPAGGAAVLSATLDSLEAECGCPTVRLDAGDEMQGTLESNLTYGAAVVAAFNHLGVDAAAVGNHELDWGVDTLRARQREAEYPWLAANVFTKSDGERPDWAKPFAVLEQEGVRIGVVGYLAAETAQIVYAHIVAPYEFRYGYAAIRDALDAVRAEDPDFVVILAHAAGDCDEGCSGEMVDLASELPPGSVDLIVGGHSHGPGDGVVHSVPIVRAGAYGSVVGVTDLYRLEDGTHAFALDRRIVFPDLVQEDASMTVLLAPYLRAAEAVGKEQITVLADPLSRSATGDRRLGRLIAASIRLAAAADVGMHNPGGVRADLPGGPVTYMDLFRVMPFGNTVVRVTLTGRQLRDVAAQAGPDCYWSNLRVEFDPLTLSLADGGPVLDDRTYELATNDFLVSGGDGLTMLRSLPRSDVGLTLLDAVIRQLRTMEVPVELPLGSEDAESREAVTH